MGLAGTSVSTHCGSGSPPSSWLSAAAAGIILYLAAWVLIPEEGTDTPAVHHAVPNDRGAIIGGLILVSIGLVLLLNVLLPWFIQVMWPLLLLLLLLLVAAGAALVFAGSRRCHEGTADTLPEGTAGTANWDGPTR